jgi:hypothetical protein
MTDIGGTEALEALMNDGLHHSEVKIFPGGEVLKPKEASEEELQARRADLKTLLYELSETSGSRMEAVEKLIHWALPVPIVGAIIPETELERARFFQDEATVIDVVAGLIEAELEKHPMLLELKTKGNKTPMFGAMADQVFTFYVRDDLEGSDLDTSLMKLFAVLLRIDTALGGELDMHCPQCGRRLGMAPHLCEECAKPTKSDNGRLEEQFNEADA